MRKVIVTSLFLQALLSVLYFAGCDRRDEMASNVIAPEPVSQVANKQLAGQKQYKSDFDRLSKIAGRVNIACNSGYSVVLGTSSSDGMVGVDFGLFSELSDSGVAVAIAEAITEDSIMQRKLATGSNQLQQVLLASDIMHIDETTGICLGKAVSVTFRLPLSSS